MSGIYRRLKDCTWGNPILLNELTRSFRHCKITIIQTIYLFILTAVIYMIWVENSSYRLDPAYVGKDIFNAILFIQYLFVTILCPAFTCADISSEIEKQSFDLLITSLLSSREIILGKLGSTVTHIILFLLSSIPLTCLVFYFGGISPSDIVLGYLFILFIGGFYSMLGIFMSARVRRTSISIALTYGIALVLFIFSGPFFNDFFSYNSNIFSRAVDLLFFEVPLWAIFFFDLLSISFLLFLGASYLIEIPVPKESVIFSLIYVFFYFSNVLLCAFIVCAAHSGSGYCDVEACYHLFLFISMVTASFFIWPGEWYADRKRFKLRYIFCLNNRFTMFFIPLLTLFGALSSGALLAYYSVEEFSLIITLSGVIIIFVYFISSMGRWVSHFFDKEEFFICTFLAILWGPVILSAIIRNATSYNSEAPVYIKILDPFKVIDILFRGSSDVSLVPMFFIIYIFLALIFNMMTYINWPVKKIKF